MADVSAASLQSMPSGADYWVDSSNYTGNMFERFGDWFTGRDRYAEYQAAQQKANYQYQDAYNKWLAGREDSQYQRMVEDLKKAGLNPALAISNGLTGSSSNAVSAPKTSAAKVEKKENGMSFFKDLATTALKVATLLYVLG